MLGDESTTSRVVMQAGDWDAVQAIDPSLTAPTPEVVTEAFDDVDY